MTKGWCRRFDVPTANRILGSFSVFDGARNETLILGANAYSGTGPGPPDLGDTLGMQRWRSGVFDTPTPVHTPRNRVSGAVCFHPGTGKVYLFGGIYDTSAPFENPVTHADCGILNDLWEWDGSDWTQLIATGAMGSPGRREGARMEYDPITDRIILFGGVDPGNVNFPGPHPRHNYNDTWSLDVAGPTWTQLTPAHSPAWRILFAMRYDQNLGRIILAGGEGAANYRDLWDWNGTDWTNEGLLLPFAVHSTDLSAEWNPSESKTFLIGNYDSAPFAGTVAYDGTTKTITDLTPALLDITSGDDTERFSPDIACLLRDATDDVSVTTTWHGFTYTYEEQPLAATTEAADGLGETTATLHGNVVPNTLGGVDVKFEYGRTTAYGTVVTQGHLSEDSDTHEFSADLTGLVPGALYHFRIVATNGGETDGDDSTFVTAFPSDPPVPTAPPAAPGYDATVVEQGNTWWSGISPGNDGDGFGSAVAVSEWGGFVVVGAPEATVNGFQSGAVYIYSARERLLEQILLPADAVDGMRFGAAVAIDRVGSFLLVGAPGSSSDIGRAYSFVNEGVWVQQDEFTADSFHLGDSVGAERFGAAVAVSGKSAETVGGSEWVLFAIGAPAANGNGRVYTSTQLGTLAFVDASDGSGDDWFGISVALSYDGSVLVVGAVNADKAYVYSLPGASELILVPGDLEDSLDMFGWQVAVSDAGDVVAVGAPQHPFDTSTIGKVYVFHGADFATVTPLVPSDGSINDQFGFSLAISADGTQILVSGRSYGKVYRYSGAGWATELVLGVFDDPDVGVAAGPVVGRPSDNFIVVGCDLATATTGVAAGTAVVYTLRPSRMYSLARTPFDGGVFGGFLGGIHHHVGRWLALGEAVNGEFSLVGSVDRLNWLVREQPTDPYSGSDGVLCFAWSEARGLGLGVAFQTVESGVRSAVVRTADLRSFTLDAGSAHILGAAGAPPDHWSQLFVIDFSEEQDVFLAGGIGTDGALAKSVDGGATWDLVVSGSFTYAGGYHYYGYVTGIAWIPALSKWFVAGKDFGTGVAALVSSPDLSAWTEHSDAVAAGWAAESQAVRVPIFYSATHSRLLVGGNGSWVNLVASDDGGDTFYPIPNPCDGTGGFILAIFEAAAGELKIIGTPPFSSSVLSMFRSLDGGLTWEYDRQVPPNFYPGSALYEDSVLMMAAYRSPYPFEAMGGILVNPPLDVVPKVIEANADGNGVTVAVYKDTAVIAELDAVTAARDAVAVLAEATHVYAVQIESFDGSATHVNPNFRDMAAPPANDDFADAVDLVAGVPSGEVNLEAATVEVGEQLGVGNGVLRSVWFKWTAPSDGLSASAVVTERVGSGAGAGFATVEASVWTTPGPKVIRKLSLLVGSWASSAGELPLSVSFSTVAGTTYYVRVCLTDPVEGAPSEATNFTDASVYVTAEIVLS